MTNQEFNNHPDIQIAVKDKNGVRSVTIAEFVKIVKSVMQKPFSCRAADEGIEITGHKPGKIMRSMPVPINQVVKTKAISPSYLHVMLNSSKLLLLMASIAISILACQKDDPSPKSLAGTSWHWFEFHRGMNNQPANHWLRFSANTVQYRFERGTSSFSESGRYKMDGDRLILNLEASSDTLKIDNGKIIVKKNSEVFEFYTRVQ